MDECIIAATSLTVVIEKGLTLMDKHLKAHRRGCC